MTGPPLPPFANEPALELRRSSQRERLLEGLRAVQERLPLSAPILIGADAREGDALQSGDPGRPDRIVAVAPVATADDVRAAVDVAVAGQREWSRIPAERRARTLLAAAEWMRARRPALAALCVREAAKPWAEADGDVCEAIDFLEYYARGAVALERPVPLDQVPGEHNELRYEPHGIVAVVAPWNFPLAIPCGMAAAGLATGNAVVLKPAEQTPGCGAMVAEALRAAGVPPAALGLLQGGGDVGAALVNDPRVATIAFTGSNAVGLGIVAAAARVAEGQRHLKRAVVEMGGKNCVIVDSDADLDETVPALVRSAFAYAGQKCSAASRVLVHEAIAETLLERLAGATELLSVGQADTFGTDVPPLIERAARDRVARYVEQAAAAGRLAGVPVDLTGESGWFVAPAVAADLDPGTPVLREEVFGPLLTVERVRDVDEACDRVEELPFALTGGLFSRNPHTVDRVIRRSPVGNLYINRAVTGAMVGRQPFGGNRLSGTGTKAGGPGYLMRFVAPKVVTENTVRHGLVV